MGVPCRRAVSIGVLTLRPLAAAKSIPFRAAAKMISELRAVVAAIARRTRARAAGNRRRESECVY